MDAKFQSKFEYEDAKFTIKYVDISQEELEKVVSYLIQDLELYESNKQLTIYINKKKQLIKISQKENKDGSFSDMHEILSFDIDSLSKPDNLVFNANSIAVKIIEDSETISKPTSRIFDYGATDTAKSSLEEDKFLKEDEDSDEDLPTFGGKSKPAARKKIPVKDGISQQAFIMKNMRAKALVSNPDKIYYTLEDVKQHRKADDCWTVFENKVYDITSYIKSHPGGKKIMAGAGKDCTELYYKYHPWVNAKFIIGKLQIGVLKR